MHGKGNYDYYTIQFKKCIQSLKKNKQKAKTKTHALYYIIYLF